MARLVRREVNIYALKLKGVTKLRYVPMGDYYRILLARLDRATSHSNFKTNV